MIFKAASPPFLFQVYPETENVSMIYSHNTAILGRAAGEESFAGAQPILQKSFKGALGQISPTSAKRTLFALLATSFCDPPGDASKAGLCPKKLLKISAMSGKMTVCKGSHRQEVAKAHGAAAAMKKRTGFWRKGLDRMKHIPHNQTGRIALPFCAVRAVYISGALCPWVLWAERAF